MHNTGIAGSGKTYEGEQIFKNEKTDKKIVLSFTNKACNVIRKRFQDHNLETDCIYTLSKYLNDEKLNINKIIEKLIKLDTIWIDEVSMCPTRFLNIIYKAWLTKKMNGEELKIILSGDMHQIISIENNKRYNILKSYAINQMCPNYIKLKYRKESSRYDKKTYKLIKNLLKTGKINTKLNKIIYSETNLCKFNKTRQQINKLCDEKHKGKPIIFIYQGKKEQYKVYEGLKLMCTNNLYKNEMYNGEIYTLDKIDGCNYTINNTEFEEEEFKNNFIVAYCITACKYQGDKIECNYNIFDIEAMTANELYVGLSRTTNFNYIHLDNDKLKNKYEFHNYDKEENIIYNNLNCGKYKNSKIYEIITKDNKYYIGSTTGNLNKRLNEHLKNNKSPIYKLKRCKINLVTNCSCFNRKELEAIELNYIQKYCKTYGKENMLNKNMITNEKIIEPKLRIEKTIKNKYKIVHDEKRNYYLIRWCENGIRKQIKRRYKKDKQEEVFKKINIERNKLLKESNDIYEKFKNYENLIIESLEKEEEEYI